MKNYACLKEEVEAKELQALLLAQQLRGRGVDIIFYPTALVDLQESCLLHQEL